MLLLFINYKIIINSPVKPSNEQQIVLLKNYMINKLIDILFIFDLMRYIYLNYSVVCIFKWTIVIEIIFKKNCVNMTIVKICIWRVSVEDGSLS